MSYIKKLEKDYNDSLISHIKLSQLREKYLALSEEEKKELDYNSLSEEEIKQLKAKPAEGTAPTSKTVDDNSLDLSEINANILSIKNNVSFFFWLTICSLALSIIFTLMAIA
jgi:hypothetical protein